MTSTLIEDILLQIPHFQKNFNEELSWFTDDLKLEGLHLGTKLNALTGLTRHLLRESPESPELKIIFNTLEEFLPHASYVERGTIQVCFYENFLNALTDDRPENKAPYEKFLSLLGPEGKKICRENDRFWGTKSPGLWEEE